MSDNDEIGLVRRMPAVLVMLGGTGMRAGRYALWMAKNGSDPDLQRMVEEGKIQVVAVDTDWKANRPDLFVEDYVVPRIKGRRGNGREKFRRLPQIPRLVMVKTEDITRTVQSIRSRHRGRLNGQLQHEDDGELGDISSDLARRNGVDLEDCFSWLPQIDPRAGEEISPGQARYEGAGQWRPLGRVGLFLEARAILDELREAYRRVRDSTPLDKPVRVHIVCSLSGGTGSGMFWDVAFLMRHIDPSCTITGNFLLADPFRGADRAERIEANAYAALKELAIFKNLQQARPLEVVYPIGTNGLRFRREPHDASIFDYVYVYQGFAPAISTGNIGDVNEAAIETSCFRLAQNVLAQLRQDVRARIDEGANNERSDTNAAPGHAERSYAFSSSSVAELELVDAGWLSDTLEAAYLLRVKDQLIGRHRPFIDGEEASRLLFSGIVDHLRHEGAGTGSGSRTPPPAIENGGAEASPPPHAVLTRGAVSDVTGDTSSALLVEVPRSISEDSLPIVLEGTQQVMEKAQIKKDCRTLARMRVGLERLRREAEKLGHMEGDPERRIRRLQALFFSNDFIDPLIREKWTACVLEDTWRDGDPKKGRDGDADPVEAELEVADILRDDAEHLWQLFNDGILKAERKLNRKVATLPLAVRHAIQRWRETIDDLWRDRPRNSVKIKAPGSFVQLRPALGLIREGSQDRELVEASRNPRAYGPVDQMLIVFCDRLKESLELLYNEQNVRGGMGEAFARYIHKNSATIKDRLQSLLDASIRNEEKLRERADFILGIGYDRLADVFPEPDWHFEEFDRTTRQPLLDALERLNSEETRRTLKAAAERIAALAEAVAKEFESTRNSSVAREFQRTEEQVRKWEELLSHLGGNLREGGEGAESERFIDRLARCLERHFRLEIGVLERTDDERFRGQIERMRIVLTAFLRYWAEQEAFVLARLGGEAGIRRTLENCRGRVFGKGTVAPSIQQDKLTVGKPVTSEGPEERRLAARVQLEQAFKSAAQAVLNEVPMFCREPTSRPIVYYEQLFRAGAEIIDIERYHQSYIGIREEQRGLYHIFQEGGALPNLIRDELPTQSRRAAWTCTEPGHEDRQIPGSENLCPTCMEEYRQGFRPLHLVGRKSKAETPLPCPGCLQQEVPKERVKAVPAPLIRFLWNGVRPSEQPAFDLHMERLGYGITCPENSRDRHRMFPAIEYNGDGERRLVHVYRDNGSFISTRDGTKIGHACFHCGFPITDRELEAIRDGRHVRCPRCRRVVRECHYCSHRDGALFQPVRLSHGPERCPRCSNLMHRHQRDFDSHPDEGLAMPSFCRNIFGCPAGRAPWGTAADMDRVVIGNANRDFCESCRDRKDPGLLLPWDDLEGHILRCPVCLTLLGIPRDGAVHRMAPDELVDHLRRHADPEPDRHCVLCGTQPAAVIQWMLQHDSFFDAATPIAPPHIDDLAARYAGRYTVPGVDARNGLELLNLLLQYDDDKSVFDAVRGRNSIVGTKRSFIDLEREMGRLFTGRSITPRVFAKRLATLSHMEDEIRARQDERPGL